MYQLMLANNKMFIIIQMYVHGTETVHTCTLKFIFHIDCQLSKSGFKFSEKNINFTFVSC